MSYTLAYLGALVSYGVVVYKSSVAPSSRPALTKASVSRVVLDENVQYLALSAYWLWHRARPIPITLLPFVVFSLFHVLTFIRTTLIPLLFPPPTSPAPTAGTSAPTFTKKVQSGIQTWVKANYDLAMRVVAYAEVVILLRLLLGAVLLQNSLLAPLLFAHFLRFRYVMSSFTRQAIDHVDSTLGAYNRDPRNPDIVRKAFLTGRDLIIRYANGVLSFSPPTSAHAAPAHTTQPQATTASTATAGPAAAAPAAAAAPSSGLVNPHGPTSSSSSIDAAAAAAAASNATSGAGATL